MQVGSFFDVGEVGGGCCFGGEFGDIGWWWVGFVDVDFQIWDVWGEVLLEEEVGCTTTDSRADDCNGLHIAVLSDIYKISNVLVSFSARL